MKKRNQAPDKEDKTTQKTAQQEARRGLIEIEVPLPDALRRSAERGAKKLGISTSLFVEQAIREHIPRVQAAKSVNHNAAARDLMISRRRADLLSALARELKADPREIGENAIESYLLFIEKCPNLAEAQPRFVAGEALFAVMPNGELYDRLDEACAIYDLNRDSVVDTAIGAYLDMVLHYETGSPLRESTLRSRGSSESETIEFILSRAGENARATFGKLVMQISSQPFAQACTEFDALRELTMHHPSLKDERIALEMIAEGAARLEVNK